MFSIAGDLEGEQSKTIVNFNTDSIYDLMTGSFVRGQEKDGKVKWFLTGGCGPYITGIQGRQQTFKSVVAASLGIRMSALYDSQMLIFDSELSLIRDTDRILRMAGRHAAKLNQDYVLTFDAKNKYDLESIREAIHDLGEKKKAMGKDAMITTPFIGKDGKRVSCFRPTCIFIDSYSECFSREEESLMTDKGLDDGRSKTLAMLDANKKTIILRHLNRYAAEYGLELVATAHYGTKLNLDPYAANPKFSQWSNQGDTPKNVGSKWGFLTSPCILINSLTKLQDDAKQCKYKLCPTTCPTELSELMILMQRCKGNASGLQHPFVVSQDNGFLTEATDYNYLKSNKSFGFQGNNVTHQSVFLPDVNMTRNSFRQQCIDDPRLARALQLTAQLLYIQSNWSEAGWPFPMKVEPKALMDMFMSDKSKYTTDAILHSRGYWLPDESITKDTPEYFSIMDALELYSKSGVLKS